MTTNESDYRLTMTTDESILEEMLDRATNPQRETTDELGVQMFCMEVRRNAELICKALEMIVSKIRNTYNVTQSLKAIALLEECMTKCGSDFQNEVAKFRFLNDFIRLVSVKYKGDETPPVIKQRIMKCLLLWTTEFPEKAKIRDAYDMLSKELGDGTDQANATEVASKKKRESALGIDEKLFSKLIYSNDPENLKRANLLIQHRVGQETRLTELVLQHKSQLVEVQTTVGLLNQMLDSYESEGNSANEETINLIRDLYLSCKKHKPIVQRLLELVGSVDNELVVETLEASNLLNTVLKRYKQTIVHPPSTRRNADPANNTDLLSDLLSDLPSSTLGDNVTHTDVGLASSQMKDPFAELSETFSNECFAGASKTTPDELLRGIDLLNDVKLLPSQTVETKANEDQGGNNEEPKKRAFKELREIDELSEALFKTSLPTADRVGSFKKEPQKITLNDLAKGKSNTSLEATPVPLNVHNMVEIKNALYKKQPNVVNVSNTLKEPLLEEQDDAMLSNADEINVIAPSSIAPDVLDDVPILVDNPLSHSESPAIAESSTPIIEFKQPLKHLSDIEICLDSVVPTSEQVVLLDDDDIKITLNFTEDRPSKEVSVVVISILNKSKLQITNFQFEASVKKPSKVRLLPPTDVSMPPYKPFRPPTPINQVMLLLNPTGKAVDVTCIVGYRLGDDPDAIKESFLAKDIPYVG